MKKRDARPLSGAAATANPAYAARLASGKRTASLWAFAVACVLAGAVSALAFAPFAIVPFAWLGVAVLFVAWERSTPRQAVFLGFAFGAGLFVTGAYWLLPGLLRHGGYSLIGSIAAVSLCIALLASHVALAGLCRGLALRSHVAWRLFGVMPGAFVLAEWLRSYTLTGFPWLALGYGQIDGPLAGFAPLGGIYAVSLTSAIISGALAWLWLDRDRWKVVAAIAGGLLVVGFALARVTWTSEVGRPLEVAAVQGNVPSDIKWTPEHLQPTLDLYAHATQAALRGRKLDLVVWPETAVPARPDQVAPFLAGLQQTAQTAGTTVLYGIIDVEREGAPRYFNAAIATGTSRGSYRKRHLVPLTEFLPSFIPVDWRQRKLREGIAVFTSGADVQPPIRVANVAIGTTICYETAYGRLVRDPEGAVGMLMSLTNDDWFRGTTMPAQDHQVARMRARESGREMLRVANSGVTARIAADGQVAASLPMRERATLLVTMRPRTGLTPYWRWGEAMWLVPVLATLLVSAAVGLRSKPQ